MSFSPGSAGSLSTPKHVPNIPRHALASATYRYGQSAQGLPLVRLDLHFAGNAPSVVNPAMALGLLLDRSGSMTGTYADGHVFDAANHILTQVGASGFELGFYDTRETIAGRISTSEQLRDAIARNRPAGGGTTLYGSLHGMIARLQARAPNVYAIVVTDGAFSDAALVQNYVMNQLLPSIPPDRPNAIRLHFIGAGEEVDVGFLRQLEADAANRGATLVRHHAHAHLRHAHADMAAELGTVYIGAGTHATLDDPSRTVTRGTLVTDGTTHAGSTIAEPFLPWRTSFVLEYAVPHNGGLPLTLAYRDGAGRDRQLELTVPLPKATMKVAQPAAGGVSPTVAEGTAEGGASLHASAAPALDAKRGGFRLPFLLAPETAGEQVARRARKAEIARVRQSEIARRAADLTALAAGGIPTSARERLADLASNSATAFTSNLAPDELALLSSRGVRPRGLVTGSAMYHVGTAFASSTGDCEVRVLSEAYTTATDLAVSRMEQEVRALGAHGAVGVRLTMVRHEWADKTVEVQIVGTAVDTPGPAPRRPWLSDLSGQEWWALDRAGYDPVGLVYGHCTWFILTTMYDEQIARSWSNVELVHHGQGIGRARHIALSGVKARAKAAGANGVTGVHLSRRLEEVRLSGPGENPVYEYEHHNVTVSILGTAIALRRDAPQTVPAATMILSLRDNRIVPLVTHAAAADFE